MDMNFIMFHEIVGESVAAWESCLKHHTLSCTVCRHPLRTDLEQVYSSKSGHLLLSIGSWMRRLHHRRGCQLSSRLEHQHRRQQVQRLALHLRTQATCQWTNSQENHTLDVVITSKDSDNIIEQLIQWFAICLETLVVITTQYRFLLDCQNHAQIERLLHFVNYVRSILQHSKNAFVRTKIYMPLTHISMT